MTPKSPSTRRNIDKRTELRRASQQTARRLAREAAERDWRVFLTAKFDRTWKAPIRLRAQAGAARFRELMVELICTLTHLGSDDERSVAEFSDLLAPEQFGAFLVEIVNTLENGRDPGAFWAKWIEVVVKRTEANGVEPEGFVRGLTGAQFGAPILRH